MDPPGNSRSPVKSQDRKTEPGQLLTLLLRFPGETQAIADPQRWLALATQFVSGFRPHPLVLRHTEGTGLDGDRMQAAVEVRRWSLDRFCRLRDALLLDDRGGLFHLTVESRRTLRNRPHEKVYDEIYTLAPVTQPGPAHFRAVLGAVLLRNTADLYPCWGELSRSQRQRLASYPAAWQEAQTALQLSPAEEVVETLNCLLSPEAHADLRHNLLEAAERGELRSSPEVLPWLLAWSEWNQHPGLVGLARRAALDDPQRAWEIRNHPNPQVRGRLVGLLQGDHDWIGWLAQEAEPGVRDGLRRALEKFSNPALVVDQMSTEKDRSRREAMGWLLVNWSKRIDTSQDWGALNQALGAGLIPEHRKKLKQKLATAGQLSFRSRWMR